MDPTTQTRWRLRSSSVVCLKEGHWYKWRPVTCKNFFIIKPISQEGNIWSDSRYANLSWTRVLLSPTGFQNLYPNEKVELFEEMITSMVRLSDLQDLMKAISITFFDRLVVTGSRTVRGIFEASGENKGCWFIQRKLLVSISFHYDCNNIWIEKSTDILHIEK